MKQEPKVFGPHYGGISEDDSLKGTGQVLYTENLDITSNSKFINVTRKPLSFLDLEGEILGMYFVSIGSGGYMLMCDEDKNLYRGTDIVLTTERITSFWQNSTYLYMLDSSEDIHRILLTDVWKSDWTDYVEDTDGSLPRTSSKTIFIIPLEGVTYIAYDKVLKIIDNTDGTVKDESFDFITDEIVGMTILGVNIKIYQSNGMLLLWDGETSTISERIHLGFKINLVSQLSNIDYVITGGQLGYMNGYSFQRTLNNFYSDELQSDKIDIERNININLLTELNGIFYIAGDNSNVNLGNGTDKFGDEASILTYGNKKTGMPSALNKYLNVASTGYKYKNIYGLKISNVGDANINDYLYISYKDTEGNYGVDRIFLARGKYIVSKGTGIVVYNKTDCGFPGMKKKLISIKVVAEIQDEDNSIEVYYIDDKKDNKDNMIPLGIKEKPGSTDYIFNLNDDNNGMECQKPFNMTFYNITLAVILKQGDSNKYKNNALKFYHLIMEYETI